MNPPTKRERSIFFGLLSSLTLWLILLSYYPAYSNVNYSSLSYLEFNTYGVFFFEFWGNVIGLIALSIYGAIKMDPYNVRGYPHFYLLTSLIMIFFALLISSTAGGTVNFYLFFPAIFVMLGLAVYGMRSTLKTNKRLRKLNKTSGINYKPEENRNQNVDNSNINDTKNYIGGSRTGLTFGLSIIIGAIAGVILYSYVAALFLFLFIIFISTSIALIRKHEEINQGLYITLVFLSCMAIPLISGLIVYAIARHKKLTR